MTQPVPAPAPAPDPEPDTETDEQALWDQLADLVGVPKDTDHAEIVDAVAEALDEAADPAPSGSPDPQGVVRLDATVHAELVAAAAHGRTAAAREARTERERVVSAAVTRGAITAGRRGAWLASLERDPDGVAALAGLPDGLAVPVAALGHDGSPAIDQAAGRNQDQWFSGVPSAGVAP
ncbi:hypothetical protein [Actinomycetospora soli]|uniref:hypothetical protein n=1 Tax=Actinomycetospora soli TaxID=2893887 RepID=UPI001E5B3B81|nr:hypothetical protein [Actinomycetospora soli]MCD2191674.1 hypothetical protein [Actinomycetospora soli]